MDEIKRSSRRIIVASVVAMVVTISFGLDLTEQIGLSHAQQPAIVYIYDDGGRLVRVVDTTSNQCATYAYDAGGNMLSITRGVDCLQSPTLTTLSQSSAKAGTRACVTAAGTNLLGAVVTTDNPEVTVSGTHAGISSLEVCLTVSLLSTTGAMRIYVTTAGGVVERAFQVDPPDETVITETTVITASDRSLDGTGLTVDGASVTIDGWHRFRSLALKNGAVVTHSAAAPFIASYLDLAIDSFVSVDATSKIDVSGKGFLGGVAPGLVCQPFVNPPQLDGCKGRTLGNLPGAEPGSGGSYGGQGVGGGNPVYGEFRAPVDLGSGGGGGCGFGCSPGGSGGGAVRITAGSVNVSGQVLADGGEAQAAGGSGGSIWIAASQITGGGTISSQGGRGLTCQFGFAGGGGRVALYSIQPLGINVDNITVRGGLPSGCGIADHGGAGTLFVKSGADSFGRLIIDNGGHLARAGSSVIRGVGRGVSSSLATSSLTRNTAAFPVPDPVIGALGLKGLKLIPNTAQDKTFTIIDNTATTLFTDPADGSLTAVASAGDPYTGVEQLDQLVVSGKSSFAVGDPFLPGTTVLVDDAQVFGASLTGGVMRFSNNATVEVERVQAASLELVSGAVLTHPATTQTQEFSLVGQVLGTLSVDATSKIDVSRRGYLGAGAERAGTTLGNILAGGSSRNGGGTHGGIGGDGFSGSSRKTSYGNFKDPRNPGSGSGDAFFPCAGCFAGGGSNGGGVARLTTDTLLVDGLISADGDNTNGPGGAGGSILINANRLDGIGEIRANGGSSVANSVSASGGGGRIAIYYTSVGAAFDFTRVRAAGGASTFSAFVGGSGTVFLKNGTQANGDLILDNQLVTAPTGSTPLRGIGSGASTSLSSNVLGNTGTAFRAPDATTGEIGLIGLELNPNSLQNRTFTVIDNTTTSLTVDSADGSMTLSAQPGNPYIGVYTFDNLTIRNGATMSTPDRCLIVGTLTVNGGSVTCENLSQ